MAEASQHDDFDEKTIVMWTRAYGILAPKFDMMIEVSVMINKGVQQRQSERRLPKNRFTHS